MNTIYRTREGRQARRTWCQARRSDWNPPHHARLVPTTVGHVHVVIAGNGPDLVLLPATNFAGATWLDLIASLATRHTVHAVDLPGQPGLRRRSNAQIAAKQDPEACTLLLNGHGSLQRCSPVSALAFGLGRSYAGRA